MGPKEVWMSRSGILFRDETVRWRGSRKSVPAARQARRHSFAIGSTRVPFAAYAINLPAGRRTSTIGARGPERKFAYRASSRGASPPVETEPLLWRRAAV